jgi:formylglycine-generating enzyme required for sulfatase activity
MVVKAALERVGFQVWDERDTPNEAALLKAIGDHVKRIAEAGPEAVGFLYYSGHGAADRPNGRNYLIPTDAPITHASQLELMGVSLEKVIDAMAGAGGKMSFVVFDACRNIPLQRSEKALVKGFAPIREQRGLLVAFATEPGSVAEDEGVYAKALADEIVRPGLEAGQVFRAVTRRVSRETDNRQSPEYLDKRLYDFSFADPEGLSSSETSSQQSPSLVGVPLPSAPVASPRCEGVEAAVANERRCLKPREWFKDCERCPEMVTVPPGAFAMGSPHDEPGSYDDERPVHQVSIDSPFAIGRYAITRDQYDEFVNEAKHSMADGCRVANGDEWVEAAKGSYRTPGFLQDGDHPAVCVSWDDAQAFVNWLSAKTGNVYQLPTEAEREYATRAGTTTAYWWGNAIAPEEANFDKRDRVDSRNLGRVSADPAAATPTKSGANASEQTLPVNRFKPNPWGLFQVHGNVAEWAEDCWNETHAGAPTDGAARLTGDCSRRVVRGGAWTSWPEDIRSGYREAAKHDQRYYHVGFRVVRRLAN